MKCLRFKILICANVLAFVVGACGASQTQTAQEPAAPPPAQAETQGDDTAQTPEPEVELPNVYEAYYQSIDESAAQYAYDLAVEIIESPEYNDNELGDRQAGSDAEHKTAERLEAEMKAIGLQQVTKEPVTVDRIQANGSRLSLGDTEIILHAYQTMGTGADGIDAEVVYVGDGTIWDYEEVDVSGKIVLFDINQAENWWIGVPVIQAAEMGAAAVLAVQDGGFAEVSDDAYNANDFCGPADTPTASITRTDADWLIGELEAGNNEAHLVIDNEYIDDGGTSYNVMGILPGKNSDEAVMYAAHYDAYFAGFQDDTIAATGVLAIAKAMIDSGYQPERDIYFMLHGSEEWGQSNTSYDWAIGSWRAIRESHPEWAGKLVSLINFELPAYEFGDYTYTAASPELYNVVREWNASTNAAQPEGVFADGIADIEYPITSGDDSFSYALEGVPAYHAGFHTDVLECDQWPFYYEYYHTNFDTAETYNEDVFKFNLKYYGGLGMFTAATPAIPFDFSNQVERLTAAITSNVDGFSEWTYADGEEVLLDIETLKSYGADIDAYLDALTSLDEAAAALSRKIQDLNERYAAATGSDKDAIWREAVALNKLTLAIFKQSQAYFIGLLSEDNIVPHQWYSSNITLIEETIAYLEEGDVVSACDEPGWQINGRNEWYSMNFSEAVTLANFSSYQGLSASLEWGTDRVFEWAEVSEATRSITERYEEEGGDYSEEIAIYEKALEAQKSAYAKTIAEEIAHIKDITAKIQNVG